jgi:formylglycine-generating enzyme required for sulfatase activity
VELSGRFDTLAPVLARIHPLILPGIIALSMALAGCKTTGVQDATPRDRTWAFPQDKLPAERLKSIGDTWTNSIGMKFTYIPAGEFDMGSPPTEADRDDDETLHHVKITRPFMMATTPVTQAQWAALMGDNPSAFQGDDLPVEEIPWRLAVTFCEKLSKTESKHYRLPTEAEWEYACRAGTQTPFGGSNKLAEMGWYSGNSEGRTHRVARKKPNAWGLYDMHGNVWQWCFDGYGPYAGDAVDPKGVNNTLLRVLRGGSWYYFAQNCRCAFRNRNLVDNRNQNIGFRVCLDF